MWCRAGRGVAIAVLCAIACVPAAGAQTSNGAILASRTGFVVVRGRDTLAVERSERQENLLTGSVVAPGRPWIRYQIRLGPGGRPDRVWLAVYPAGQDSVVAPLQQVDASIDGDSVEIAIGSPAGSTVRRMPLGRNGWLIVGQSSAEIDHLLAVLRRARSDSATVPVFSLIGGRLANLSVRFFAVDSAAVTLGATSMAHFDRSGRLARIVQGGGAVVVTRTPAAAAPALTNAASFAAPADAPYTLPRSAARGLLPAVVTISGSGPQDRDSYLPIGTGYRPFRQIADTLGRRGIAVLRLDDRGTGASSGNFAAATEADFAADIAAAVAFLRARPEIDPRRIALLGHSEGGVIGPLVAARDGRIAALVVMAGPAVPRDAVLEQNRRSIATDTTLTQAQRDSVWRRVPAMLDSVANTETWLGGFLRYDARATAAQIAAPVLILQGATDTQVPPEQAMRYERFFREGGNRQVTTIVFPQRNHLFLLDSVGDFAAYHRLPSTTVDREVLGTVADWLARVLAPNAGVLDR